MSSVKVDARKIQEIAKKLGVSERTVEEYLLDRLTLQQGEEVGTVSPDPSSSRPRLVDRHGNPVENDSA